MRQTRCVRRACTGHARRHSSSFFFYPYRPALRRLLLPLSSCRGRSRSKKRRRGARAREVRERARSRVTILTVSRSCIGGATRENVVGGAGPGPSELSVCLSVYKFNAIICKKGRMSSKKGRAIYYTSLTFRFSNHRRESKGDRSRLKNDGRGFPSPARSSFVDDSRLRPDFRPRSDVGSSQVKPILSI